MEMLLDLWLTWTLPQQISLFGSILYTASPNLPKGPTHQSSISIFPSVYSTVSISPVVPECTACLLAAFMAQQGLKPQTISAYSAAVRHLQVMVSYDQPAQIVQPCFQCILKRIKCLQSIVPSAAHLPITPSSLQKPQEVWAQAPPICDLKPAWFGQPAVLVPCLHESGGIHLWLEGSTSNPGIQCCSTLSYITLNHAITLVKSKDKSIPGA